MSDKDRHTNIFSEQVTYSTLELFLYATANGAAELRIISNGLNEGTQSTDYSSDCFSNFRLRQPDAGETASEPPRWSAEPSEDYRRKVLEIAQQLAYEIHRHSKGWNESIKLAATKINLGASESFLTDLGNSLASPNLPTTQVGRVSAIQRATAKLNASSIKTAHSLFAEPKEQLEEVAEGISRRAERLKRLNSWTAEDLEDLMDFLQNELEI